MSTDPLGRLLEALDLTELDADHYEGWSVEQTRPRMFGGDFLAQAIMAAGRTVKDRACHSLHAHFLRPGDPSRPIEYRVRRMRDGRRFAQRLVSARQRGHEALLATVSFMAEIGESASHQHDAMPDVPPPEGLRSELEYRQDVSHRMRREDAWLLVPRAVEVRQVRPVPLYEPPRVPPVAHSWLRAIGRLPDDHLLHCAVLAYASDTTLLDIACYPHGVAWIDPRVEHASLDHAMWFHRPFRADEWVLYSQAVTSATGGRAFGRGSMFSREGALVASVTQEGLWRLPP
jgi:acyl-CoA thioesterase II